MITIIIPARNERYLKRTIEDILEKAETDIEVIAILDGYWPQEIVSDKRVKYVHFGHPKGMRNGINVGVALSNKEYIMKLDAHCMLDKGFDRKLLNDIQDNLFKRAKKFLKDNIIEVKNFEEFKEGIKQKKLVKAYFCGSTDCEESIKDETSATARCIVGNVNGNEKCVYCGKKARYVVYFGRNY